MNPNQIPQIYPPYIHPYIIYRQDNPTPVQMQIPQNPFYVYMYSQFGNQHSGQQEGLQGMNNQIPNTQLNLYNQFQNGSLQNPSGYYLPYSLNGSTNLQQEGINTKIQEQDELEGNIQQDRNKIIQYKSQGGEHQMVQFSSEQDHRNENMYINQPQSQKKRQLSEDFRTATYRRLQSGQRSFLSIEYSSLSKKQKYTENKQMKKEFNDIEFDQTKQSSNISEQVKNEIIESSVIKSTPQNKQNKQEYFESSEQNAYEKIEDEHSHISASLQRKQTDLTKKLSNKKENLQNQQSSQSISIVTSSHKYGGVSTNNVKLEQIHQQKRKKRLAKNNIEEYDNIKELNPIKKTKQLIFEHVNFNQIENSSYSSNYSSPSSSFSQQQSSEPLSLDQNKKQQLSLDLLNNIKYNIESSTSVSILLEQLQFQLKQFTQLEILSKCIYITEQSQTHKIFQNIVKQPFFAPKDQQQQQILNIPSISKESSSPLPNNSSLEQQKKQLPPLQNSQQKSSKNKTSQNNKQSTSTISKQQQQDDPFNLQNYEENVRKWLTFYPRDIKMLNLYKFSVMRQFPDRKINKKNDNQESNNINTINDDPSQFNKTQQNDDDSNTSNHNQPPLPNKSTKKTIYSRFHNLNKLFIYNIMAMLQSENLDNFGIPISLKSELHQFLKRLKQSGKIRPYQNNPYQTETFAVESFSHVHYNVLFLKINEHNISIVRKSPRDIFLHLLCFNIDLNNCLEIEITKINLLKKLIFQIFIQSIQEHLYVDDNSHSKSNNRVLYSIKAIKGIKKLALGIYFNRF